MNKAVVAEVRTDEIGDCKIFILPVEDVMHVREGDKGESVI